MDLAIFEPDCTGGKFFDDVVVMGGDYHSPAVPAYVNQQ